MAAGGVRVLDKTPAYVQVLPDVLRRAPGVPCIVMMKGGKSHPSVVEARREFGDRMLEVNYEDLLRKPHLTMRRICTFLRLDGDAWREEYLNMTGVRVRVKAVRVCCIASRPLTITLAAPPAGENLADCGTCERGDDQSQVQLQRGWREVRPKGPKSERRQVVPSLPETIRENDTKTGTQGPGHIEARTVTLAGRPVPLTSGENYSSCRAHKKPASVAVP